MAEFNYKPHEPPSRPFKVGDRVVLVDSQGVECGEKRIARIQATTVKTDCGRTYMKDGRWYTDRVAWPFPWIRLSVSEPSPHSTTGDQ